MEDYDLFVNDDNSSSFYLDNIKNISPVYAFESGSRVDGYFEIRVGLSEKSDNILKVPFRVILNHKLQDDNELYNFLMKNYSDKSLSKAITDLYDIGFPVNDWVKEYITDILDNSPKYYALLSLINFLKKLREDDDSSKKSK